MEIVLFRCTQCGAVLEIDAAIKKYKCQYCGASYVKKESQEDQKQTEGNRVTAQTIIKQAEKQEEGRYFESASLRKTKGSIDDIQIFEAFNFEQIEQPFNKDERVRHLESWTKQIRRIEDYKKVPENLRLAYETDAAQTGFNSDIYMLYCPPFEREGIKFSKKLLYVIDFSLICIEEEYRSVVLKKFRIEDLEVMEIGSVLLDGWITVVGKIKGKSEMITVYYNDANSALFEKLIEILRALALGAEYPPKYDITVSNSIKDKSFNFTNYTRNLIFKSESPVEYILQNTKAHTGEHMLMRTKSEVIQIIQGIKRKGVDVKYGHTNTFFIRKHMNRPEYFIDNRTQRLKLNLSSGTYCRIAVFEKDMHDAIEFIAKL